MESKLEQEAKDVSMGYCEHHTEFENKINCIIEVQEDKMMDIWKMTKGELYKIVLDSQEVILGHINGLKDMVTNFLNTTARATERHDKEIEKLNIRMQQIEKRYHDGRKKE
jgi:hypothetical protein